MTFVDSTSSSTTPETLPPELREFVQDLAVAVHKRGIYPPAHPMQLGAVDAVMSRLELVLSTRQELAIGVARTQLMMEGYASDPAHPLLHELAGRMYDHQLGGLRITPGVSRIEIDECVAALAESPLRGGVALGARPDDDVARWPHLTLVRVAFEQLSLLDDEGSARGPASRSARASELWGALARAALAGVGGEGDDAEVHDPRLLARSIERRLQLTDVDEHLSDVLLQAMGEIGSSGSSDAAGPRKEMSELVEHLSEGALQQLIDMGGDHSKRNAFLVKASDTLGAHAVLDLVRVAAEQDGAPISSAVLRLLQKLAREASGTRAGAKGADVALRRVVRRLLREWTLDDPNPESYSRILADIAADGAVTAVDRRRDSCEPERLLEISLDVSIIAPSTESALGRLVMRDGVAATLERLEALPETEERESLIGRLINESTLREQLAAARPDLHVLGHAVDRLRLRAIAPLIQALEGRDEVDAPWVVTLLVRQGFDGLEPLGAALREVSPRALRHLLLVFDRLDAWPPGADPFVFARHDDPLVRREAIRYLLKHDDTREQGALLGLRDADMRTFNQAIHVVLRSCSLEGARILMRRFDDPSLGSELRSRVVRAIAAARTPEVLEWLRAQVLTTRWLVGTLRLRKPSAEVLAIVTAIAQQYRGEPSADQVLQLAMRSRDDGLRRAASARADAAGVA